ncbi:MAG TPA: Ig-like domain-containing protein [Propionibacteriaceae bacterium]|nr:Ig-like domain-containing protein [Propionibacteriaceae bacterium]
MAKRAVRAMPRRRRVPRWVHRSWAGALVGLLSLSLVVAAVAVPGFTTADLRLHDGSVFAVKQDGALLGQINTQIKDLSTAHRMADSGFDIQQEGRTIIVSNPSSNQVQTFDPATGEPGGAVALPDSGELVINGGHAAVISRLNGSVWFGTTDEVLAKDFNKEKAKLDLGEAAKVAITVGGTLIGLSLRDSAIVKLTPGAQETRVKVPLGLEVTQPNVQVSAVGERAVVLDRSKQLLWFEGADETITIPAGSTAQLAAPSPATTHLGGEISAIIATPTGILGARNRELKLLSGTVPQGTPGVPVTVGDCIHAVVGSRVVTTCGSGSPRVQEIPQLPNEAKLVLRANRDAIILNDVRTGYVWLVDDGMRLISDWEKVTPKKVEQQQQQTNEVRPIDPVRGKNPPIAVDDKLQARAGRSTILPVLDNDSDPDGDVLVVSAAPDAGQGVKLQLVRGGSGLQVTVDPEVTGTRTFSYTINDGVSGSASAKVTLTILPPDQATQNTPPVQWRNNPIPVALGKTTSIRALLDWRDPEGDDVVLKGATVAEGDDEVSFTPDGTLTFTDVGKRPGLKTINVEVSDGDKTAMGTLVVDARKASDVPPLANGDFYTTTTGTEIEIKPLLNDQGTNLSLMNIDSPVPVGPTVTPDYLNSSFRFVAKLPGTYYIGYKVSSGPWSYGLIRIDVTDSAVTNRAPVAQRDVALLTHGGSVTIDPLINDEDPDGDVMVVQTYSTHPGLQIEMRDRHLMTIREIVAQDQPITITYQVSDGHFVVPGTIVVIPTKPIGEVRPIAVSDDVNVRVGDSVSVRPLANDYSPVGLDITLDPKLLENAGNAWVDGEYVRFVAPSVPGRVTATYQVQDSLGRKASAQIRFNVISADVVNQPPSPLLVTGRVLAGSVSRIQVPLQNIDMNGDTVRLVGLHTGPALGRVLAVGPRWLEYEAYAESRGTDSFKYVVTDSSGAKGIGEIRIGVVPASQKNTRPTAVDDTITTRPGRDVVVVPLTNDFDVDGDKISLVNKESVSFPFPVTVNDDSTVAFKMPNEKGRWVGTYAIKDARGEISSGNVTMVADPAAPLLAPVTHDDLVDAKEVFQRDAVDVPVLSNDFDPDGPKKDLTLSVPPYDTGGGPAATVVDSEKGPVLRVPIGDRMRTIRYAVTDADNLTSYGFVLVPGKADAVPTLKDPNVELTILAGEPLKISVGQYVQGTQGRKVRLTSADLVSASPGSGRMESSSDLIYQAGIDYSGPAAITFQVIEDLDSGQTDARSATITMKIKVEPRPLSQLPEEERKKRQTLNQAPSAPEINIEVGAGEAPVTRDLFSVVTDPEGDRFEFGQFQGTIPPGLSFSANGGVVTASGAVTGKGQKATLSAEVVDIHGARGRVTLTVTVLASTRPRTSVGDDSVPEANQGMPSIVNVLENDRSSLTDTTLTVLPNPSVESGSGTATVNDNVVTVTPDPTYVGVMRVRYTVQDATKDPERNAQGVITLTVRGKPSAPGTPRQEGDVGNGQLTVTWTSALDNGLPIKRYIAVATAPNGATGMNDKCETTTCTIQGLTNGGQYTVKVAAENQLGLSPQSAESAVIVPNVKPEKMAAPTVERGPGPTGKQLQIHWPAGSAVKNEGTPITGFTIVMVGTMGQTTLTSFDMNGQNTYIWKELVNGQGYQFTIQATNAAGTSVVSDPSAVAVPSAPTSAPVSVTAADDGNVAGGNIKLTWAPPLENNGSAPTSYKIVRGTSAGNLNEVLQQNAQAPTTSVPASNGVAYFYGVIAVNAAGESPAGVTATAVKAFGAPEAKGAPVATDGDLYIRVKLPEVKTNGADVDQWEVRQVETGATRIVSGNPSYFDFPLANTPTLTTFVVTPSGSGKAGSTTPASNQAHPRGAPGVPTMNWDSLSGQYSTTFQMAYSVSMPTFMNGNRPEEIELYVIDVTSSPVSSFSGHTGWMAKSEGGTIRAFARQNGGARLQGPTRSLVADPMIALTRSGMTVTAKLNYIPEERVSCSFSSNASYAGPDQVKQAPVSSNALGNSYTISSTYASATAGAPAPTAYYVSCDGLQSPNYNNTTGNFYSNQTS